MTIVAFPILREAEAALAQGDYGRAGDLAMQHARRNPREPRGIALLGEIALKMGALTQAEHFIRSALSRDPHNYDLLRNLSAALHQQERLVEALPLFERLTTLRPGDSEVQAIRSLMLDKLGRPEEARAVLNKLVDDYPDNPGYWIAFGHNLRAAGMIDEAVAAYRHAIALDEERGDAWWGIASIKKNVFSDADLAAMTAAIAIVVDNENRAPLHFAMARAMHDRQRFAEAFDHYSDANRLWAELLNYDGSELTQEVDQATAGFGSAFLSDTSAGDPSNAPIFIVSLPRSGSTLLEQMLDRHDQIEALGEMPYIPALMRLMMEGASVRGPVSVPDAIAMLSPSDRTRLGADYLERARVHHKKPGATRFVDKLPHNWSNIAFIRRILPNARIIDIRRDAMSCCFSNFTHSFSRAHASSFALKDIGRTYVDYVRLMDHFERAAPGMVHAMSYERLIDEPEPVLRDAFAYLGLPFDDSVLRFHESRRNVRTPSAEQVRRPLNKDGVGNWRPYAQWLGPLREALGDLAQD